MLLHRCFGKKHLKKLDIPIVEHIAIIGKLNLGLGLSSEDFIKLAGFCRD